MISAMSMSAMTKPMLAIDDLKGLLSLVQASVLEIHPWGSRLDDLEQPDRIIFDLDPGEEVPWKMVIAAAAEVRDRLKDQGLTSFVKTTGGKGLHVVAPLVPKADWDTAKEFTRDIAEQMAADSPDLYVAKMTKAIRQGKIFVDYFRNGREATAVAAYSTRARKSAAVSTPLAWSELSEAITRRSFHGRQSSPASRLPQARSVAGVFQDQTEAALRGNHSCTSATRIGLSR